MYGILELDDIVFIPNLMKDSTSIVIKGVPIPVSVSVSEPIPVVSVSDRYRCL